ncbi:FAD-dependent 5-carboxymethylaminomethyl-2-thiouridine(34) oxidoreductase MnmC, partial [Vibrio sp. 2094]
LPMGQVKGQVSHAPATKTLSKLKTVLCYDGYMTPVNPNNQHLCIGASYDRSHLDYEFDENAQRDNVEKLVKCIPNQEWTKEVDTSGNLSRQGIRCVSRDHLPFVGNVGDFDTIKTQYADLQNKPEEEVEAIHQFPNLFCFLGLGSRGLSSAPLLAEVLASQICGDPLPLPVDV